MLLRLGKQQWPGDEDACRVTRRCGSFVMNRLDPVKGNSNRYAATAVERDLFGGGIGDKIPDNLLLAQHQSGFGETSIGQANGGRGDDEESQKSGDSTTDGVTGHGQNLLGKS